MYSEKIQKELETFKRTIEKANLLYQKGFQNKSQQKDCLYYISYAYESYRHILQYKILEQLWEYRKTHNDEDDEYLNNLYYSVPSYPHLWKEKHEKEYQNYQETSVLSSLRDMYFKVKNTEINTKKESPLEKKEKQYQEKLQKHNRDIKDNQKYEKGINKIIISTEKMLTPIYHDSCQTTILYWKMPLSELKDTLPLAYYKKIKEFKEKYKSEQDIISYYDTLKKLELLDIKYQAMMKINFDINTVKLKTFDTYFKQWIINDTKLFEIKIIMAGGYNIQKLHHRTLINIKSL